MAETRTDERPPEPAADELLTVTDTARALLVDARDAEGSSDDLGVRVEAVDRHGTVGYDLTLEPVAAATDADVVQRLDGELTLLVGPASVELVRGATLDARDGSLVMQRPETVPGRGAGPAPTIGDPDDPLARRIRDLLADQINPALASHGGHADLVGVEGTVAYVTMSGGCQGCGLAAVTLRDGIQAMILDAVPEVTEVLDATDHAAGTAPYYAP